MTNIITLAIAILPIFIIGLVVYKKDILEKEPAGLLIKLFFLGILSTLPSVILELLASKIIPVTNNNVLDSFVLAFFGVAMIEEGYKAIFTYSPTYTNKNFNHIYDGIVYAVFVSLGFATLENVLYVLDFGRNTAILRAFTSVPAHAFYGVSMGYYMGIAKYNEKIGNLKECQKNKIISIVLPIIFHGTFDFLLLMGNQLMIILFFAFVIVLYVVAYIQIKKHSRVMTMLE